MTTATKLAALARKQTPSPTAAMRIPAIAGPTARAALLVTEFKVTALRTSEGPTISRTKACREGFSKVLFRPSTTARTQTSHKRTTPSTVSNPSTNAWRPMQVCNRTINRRLSTRSAMTPP